MTRFVCLFFTLVFSALPGFAQQSASPAVAGGTVVPSLVNFSGDLQDVDRKPLHGTIGVTFSLYREQQGGSPIWLETQNVQPDSAGHYTVQLGSMTKQGLPMDLFISGEAQWLGVQVQGHEEQPRIMLLSVPYALKAGDAQTLGGLPPSAFLVAPPVSHDASPSEQGNQAGEASGPSVGGSGTADYIPLWTDSQGTLGNSIVFQSGSGSSARLGINLKNPLATVDVNGQELVRGLFEMATTGIANQNKGFSSNPINLESSAFSSSTGKNTLNHFQWQAEPAGNNTSSPGASLNLLYGTDPAAPSETGLKLSSTGVFAFAAGQKFPGTGTVTSVGLSAPSSDFTVSGSPITKSGTLALNWSVAPTDADTVNAIVKRDANGGFSAGPISAAAGGQGGTYGVYGVGVEGGIFGNGGSYGVYGQGATYGVYGHGSYGVGGEATDLNGYGLYAINDAAGTGLYTYTTSVNAYTAYLDGPSGHCSVNGNGSLICTGPQSAVVPVDGGSRQVALYAMDSPENWFEDFGSGRLRNGEAAIQLERVFAQTANTGMDYYVFPVPNGDCKGLYVAGKTASGFVVRELGGGRSNIAFDYRIIARRKGYENIRLADKTKEFTPKPKPNSSPVKRPISSNTPQQPLAGHLVPGLQSR